MAHQAHSIPWQTLAAHIKYVHCNPRNNGVTNLFFRKTKDPKQAKELKFFVGGFIKALEDYSAIERRKFATEPPVPDEDEVLISDASVRKMARTVLRYKGGARHWPMHYDMDGSGGLDISISLDDILSPYERSAKRFIQDTMPGEGDMFDEAQEACEQTKTMLMYGEMDALLSLAAHPQVYFYRLWHEDDWANAHGFGLYKLVEAALEAYICLNVIFLFPELYDPASRARAQAAKKHETVRNTVYDYRLTAAYQQMLLSCTGVPYGRQCDAHTYPHRAFFGILPGMFRFDYDDTPYGRWQKEHLGTQSVAAIAHDSFQNTHIPSQHEMPIVLNLLGAKGLPAELALHIVELAEYKPVGRLWIRDDPFHKENLRECEKYLAYCWKLLVRMDILCKAGVHGERLNWEDEVVEALWRLFDGKGSSSFGMGDRAEGRWSGWGRRRRRVLVGSG